MYRILIAFLFAPCVLMAQQTINFQSADSVTYQSYLLGDWEKLINYGEEAIRQDVDFKNLRKRMGYAYFVKNEFYLAQQQYRKALKFDANDADVKLYLYYCGLNAGDKGSTNYYASKLSDDNKKMLNIKAFKILDAVDLEFNYKINSVSIRSNPTYLRAGVSTQLGHRLSLYQSSSTFSQSESNIRSVGNPAQSDVIYKTQNEYYASLNWQISAKTSLLVAYHYLYAQVIDTTIIIDNRFNPSQNNYKTTIPNFNVYPGNMFIGKFSTKINKLDVSLYGSTYTLDTDTTTQLGLQVGYLIPGQKNIYLKSSLYQLTEAGYSDVVFSQSVGLFLNRNLWFEGSFTLGELTNYAEGNGLYMFNSSDNTTFRIGGTLLWYAGKNISLFGNYGFDKKTTTTNFTTIYNQNSISGGLIWKL